MVVARDKEEGRSGEMEAGKCSGRGGGDGNGGGGAHRRALRSWR